MRIGLRLFNTYLLLSLAFFSVGCESLGKKKEASTIRLHAEVNADGSDKNGRVAIDRENPIYVNIDLDPFLSEQYLKSAAVLDAIGGFSIYLQFDQKGTWLLEQYSAANKGRRVVIGSQFGETRWLAAPVFNKRITDGTLAFTPDATRTEAERIVRGLNNVAKKLQ
jgi:hypothetical protein